jgi:hypothetical protein
MAWKAILILNKKLFLNNALFTQIGGIKIPILNTTHTLILQNSATSQTTLMASGTISVLIDKEAPRTHFTLLISI